MAILKTAADLTPIEKLHKAFIGATAKGSEALLDVSNESFGIVTGKVLSEADNSKALNNLENTRKTLAGLIEGAMGGTTVSQEHQALGFTTNGIAATKSQLDAAVIMFNALRDEQSAKAYQKLAMNTSVSREGNVPVIDFSTNASYGYMDRLEVSNEAFDARTLTDFRGYNLLFAFSAAIQNPEAELLFRTVTLTPDTTGLEISISRTLIMEEIRHSTTGQPVDWKRRHLLDAISDPTIIMNNTTEIFPRVIPGNAKNEASFTDKADIAPAEILGNQGAKVLSAPLRPGVDIDLIGLGHNENVPGQSDQTDSLDHNVTVTDLYYKVTTADGTSIIHAKTKGLAKSGFLKSLEGQNRDITLAFPYEDFVLNGQTTDITGQPAAALAFLTTGTFANTQIRMKAYVSGFGNVQFGRVNVNSNAPTIAEVRDVDGTGSFTQVTDETTLEELAGKFTKIELIGYKVKALRSNLNRRQMGLLIDTESENVRYVVPLSPPISVQKPITDTATSTDLAGPLNAQRLMNSVNAITKVFEVLDTLRNVVPQINYTSPTSTVPNIEGFSRLAIRPYLVDDRLNVADVVTNIASSTRTKDVMATIVNKLRFAVTKAYTESRYQPALDSITGTSGEKPTVAIVTDPTTAAYLAVEGDWRTIIGFDVKVEVSYDLRMRGKIVATFVRPGVNDVDIMSFGCMAYIPELTTKAMIPYNGASTDVMTVQSRTLHVCTLPILIHLEIEGLETAATDAVGFNVALN